MRTEKDKHPALSEILAGCYVTNEGLSLQTMFNKEHLWVWTHLVQEFLLTHASKRCKRPCWWLLGGNFYSGWYAEPLQKYYIGIDLPNIDSSLDQFPSHLRVIGSVDCLHTIASIISDYIIFQPVHGMI